MNLVAGETPVVVRIDRGKCRGERRRTRAASGIATSDIPRNKMVIGPNKVAAACTEPSAARPKTRAMLYARS